MAGINFDDLSSRLNAVMNPVESEAPTGTIKEMGKAFTQGLFGVAPSMAGQAIKAFSPVDSDVYKFGQDLQADAESIVMSPKLQRQGYDQRGEIAKLAISGAGAVGQMAPVIAASAVAPALGAGIAGGLYSGSTYQDTKERMLKQEGLTDSFAAANPSDERVRKANQTGIMTGGIQGAIEAPMTYLGGKFIKGAALPVLNRLGVKGIAGPTAEGVLAAASSPGKAMALQFGKGMALRTPLEGGTEVLQDEGQAAVERAAGLLDAPAFGAQAAESFRGGAGAALLMGPLGVPGHYVGARKGQEIRAILADPSVDPQVRLEAASVIGGNIANVDKDAAKAFMFHAANAIGDIEQTGTAPYALDLNNPELLKPGAPVIPAASAPPSGTLGNALSKGGIATPAAAAAAVPIDLTAMPASIAPALSIQEQAAQLEGNPYDANLKKSYPWVDNSVALLNNKPPVNLTPGKAVNGNELMIDEARAWAAKAPGMQRQTGESQSAHLNRVVEGFKKQSQAVNPKAPVLMQDTLREPAAVQTVPQGDAALDLITDEEKQALALERDMASMWEKGSRQNGRSNKAQLFPWLDSWGKTTPAEVATAIDNYLAGKRLGDVQKQLVIEALKGSRDRHKSTSNAQVITDQENINTPVVPDTSFTFTPPESTAKWTSIKESQAARDGMKVAEVNALANEAAKVHKIDLTGSTLQMRTDLAKQYKQWKESQNGSVSGVRKEGMQGQEEMSDLRKSNVKPGSVFAAQKPWKDSVDKIGDNDEARLTAAQAQELVDKHGDGTIQRITNRSFLESGVDQGKADYGHRFVFSNNKSVRGVTSFFTGNADEILDVKVGNEGTDQARAEMVHYKVRPADIGGEFIAIKKGDGYYLYSDSAVDGSKAEIVSHGRKLKAQYDKLQESKKGVAHETGYDDEITDTEAELIALGVEIPQSDTPKSVQADSVNTNGTSEDTAKTPDENETADKPLREGPSSEVTRNRERFAATRTKAIKAKIALTRSPIEKARLEKLLSKIRLAVTRSQAESIPDADDTAKDTDIKRAVARKDVERLLFSDLTADAELQKIAGMLAGKNDLPGFIRNAGPLVAKKINALAEEAETGAIRELYAEMMIDGVPDLPKEFYSSLQKEAKKSAEQTEKDRNRDPEVYRTALEKSLIDAGIGADKVEASQEFKEGFDHALKGKTKSTLPQDKENYQYGYSAAQLWMKSDEGRAWYEGKRINKEKSTGEALKRQQDRMRKDLDSVTADDMKKAWKQLLKVTVRADLFPNLMEEDATPGAQEWFKDFRSNIATFQEYFLWEHMNETSTGKYNTPERAFTGNWSSYRGRGVNAKSDEQSVALAKEIAAEYQTKVAELAQRFKGVRNLDGIRKLVLADLFPNAVVESSRSSWTDNSPLYQESKGLIEPAKRALYQIMPAYGKHGQWERLIESESRERAQKDRVTPLVRPRLDKILRTGLKDYRSGKDISAEELKRKFSFADVTIGNYVTAQQAQDHLNYVYDAFMTMADMFGTRPEFLSFGGKLHFAIGALGHGKYAAHFQANQAKSDGTTVPVINVTNTRGDGALLHEFFHAIDFLTTDPKLKQIIGEIKQLLKRAPATADSVIPMAERFLSGGSKFTNQGRGTTPKEHALFALREYYARQDKAGRTTKFYNDALKLDNGNSKNPYWSNDAEPFARMAEAWGFDILKGQNQRDDYLVADWCADGKTKPPEYKGTPYPEGDERARLVELFNKLVKAIAWTPKGPVLDLNHQWHEKGPSVEAWAPYHSARKSAIENIDDIKRAMERRTVEKQAEAERKRKEALFGAPEEASQAEPPSEVVASTDPAVGVSVNELEALFDEAVSELREASQEQPAAEPPGAKLYEHQEKVEAVAEPKPLSDAQEKTAAALAKEFAQHGVKGIDEALKGLVAIFGGGPNKLQSFPAGFDEDAYKQAKPHFEAAAKAFGQAGQSFKDFVKTFFKAIIQTFGEGVKPYAVQFAKEYESVYNEQAQPAEPISEPVPEESDNNPTVNLAQWVRGKLNSKPLEKGFSWQELFQKADQFFGGTQAQGTYSVKDAYDAMELGVNQYLLDNAGTYNPGGTTETAGAAASVLDQIEQNILRSIPTQTKRTQEMEEFQQFSTPPHFAYPAAWVANIDKNDVTLEPHVGTGAYAIFAKIAGGQVIVNELSARRLAIVRNLPFDRFFSENAEQLDNILPADVQPSVILMNPPFSSTAGRVQGQRDSMNGAKHIEQALKRLQEGGRLVAIVGESMAHDKPAFRDWWNKIEQNYSVRANISIDGSSWKYGTSFGMQILVIDKTGKTDGQIVTGKVGHPREALTLLEDIRNDRKRVLIQNGRLAEDAGGAAVQRVDQAAEPSGVATVAVEPETRSGTKPAAATSELSIDTAETTDLGEISNSTFEQYTPKKLSIPGAVAHNTPLVESAAMASVVPPDPSYTPNLPKNVIEKGLLSLAQLEAVVYAGQAHAQTLRDGETRRGFFLGDGCVAGETRIYNPDTGDHTAISDLVMAGEPITVLSLTSHGYVKSTVPVPFLKGVDNLYRVTLQSGRSVIVTDNHKFLTPDGWYRIVDGLHAGHFLASVEGHPAYSLGFSPSTHVEGEVHYSQTPEDCLDRCCRDSRLGDGQLRSGSNIDQGIAPLPIDVLEHNHAYPQTDDHPPLAGCNPLDPESNHLSRSNSSQVWNRDLSLSELPVSEESSQLSEEIQTIFQQSHSGIIPLHQPTSEVTQCQLERVADLSQTGNEFEHRDALENQPLSGRSHHIEGQAPHCSCLAGKVQQSGLLPQSVYVSALFSYNLSSRWDRIESIEFVRTSEFYDMYVPVYENYVAEGIVHHNTGVGKGRQISGVILDNLRQGRDKAVWISVKHDLLRDAKRDFAAIGGDVSTFIPQNKVKSDGKIDAKKGILFTAYSTLRSKSKIEREAVKANGGKKTDKNGISYQRTQQIVDWLGKNFDGVIAFDESHSMGNAIAMKGKRGSSKPSEQALAAIELQRALPNARILYVSATGATEVSNLAYAERLGLWGDGTPFESVNKFVAEMSRSVSAMELVAQNLKQMGLYQARSLSYDGVTYGRVDHELNSYQRDTYDLLAEGWQMVLNNINDALKDTGVTDPDTGKGNGKDAGKIRMVIMSAFWGSHQRFFNQVITAAAMPSALEQIDADLKDGKSIVLQLTNTNEADQNRALAKLAGQKVAEESDDDSIEELDLTPRDQLVQFIERAFPIIQYEEYTDGYTDDGAPIIRLRPVLDSKGNPVLNRDAVAKRDELIRHIKGIKIPDSPLAMLINYFGPEKIAEITGRTQRVIPGEDGKFKVEKRSSAAVAADSEAFMAGKKRILVFSQAGGTGFSFHSDMASKNQEQRVHYILQAGWSADKAVQGFGRSHRTNQKIPPIYRLVTTDIPAQKRFTSSIARRLEQLGALTSGQRDTAGGSIFSAADNLESQYATSAVRQFFSGAFGSRGRSGEYENLPADLLTQMGLDNVLDEEGRVNETKLPSTTQFLNRLLSLRLDTQGIVFDLFMGEMEAQVEIAKQLGRFDDGMQTIRHAGAKVNQEEEVYRDSMTGAATNYVAIEFKTPNPIYDFDSENGVIQSKKGTAAWFVNIRSGRIAGIYSTPRTHTNAQSGVVEAVHGVIRTSGKSMETDGKLNLTEHNWRRLEEKEAREIWEKENSERPRTVNHQLNLVVGGILPIWDRFNNEAVQVARIATDDGRRFLGRQIAAKDLASTMRKLNVSSPAAKMSSADLFASVMKGKAVELSNGYSLELVRVSGDSRIEIKNVGFISRGRELQLQDAGAIFERIEYAQRYFIPTDSVKGPKVIGALLEKLGATAVQVGSSSQVLSSESTETRVQSGLDGDTITEKKASQISGIGITDAKTLRDKGVVPVEVQGETSDMLREIAKRFGNRIVFYRIPRVLSSSPDSSEKTEGSGNKTRADGFVNPAQKNTIYLNVDSARHLLFIIGHETGHTLGLNKPEQYRKLLDDLRPYLPETTDYNEYVNRLKALESYKDADSALLYREVVSDLIGDLFISKNMWPLMAKEKPTLFKRLAEIVLNVLNKISKLFRNSPDAQSLLREASEANGIIVNALMVYAENHTENSMTPIMAETLYSESPAAFSVSDTAARLQESLQNFKPDITLDKLKTFLNPLDYSRMRQTAEGHVSPKVAHALGYFLQTPYWKQNQDETAKPFYREGRIREEQRFTNNIRMMGGIVDEDGKPVSWKQRVRDWFNWGDERTAWEDLKRKQFNTMTDKQRAAYDVIRFEGDAHGSEYGTLTDALRNPRIKAAGVDAMVFRFYRNALAAEDVAFEQKLSIARENMTEAGVSPEDIEGHIAEYRALFKDIKGWTHRDHGEGEYEVTVHRVIDRLDWITDDVNRKNGRDGFRVRLGYYPGVALAAQMQKIVDGFGGTWKQTANGTVIMIFNKSDQAAALKELNAINLQDENGQYRKVMVYNKFAPTKAAADKLKREVEGNLAKAMPVNYRQGHTFIANSRRSTSLQEEDYSALKKSDMKLEQFMTKALERARNRGEMTKDEAKEIRDAVVQNIAEALLGRGAGLYQIRRANYLIEGYDRTDAVGKFESYVHGTAGMFSKAMYALRQYKHLEKSPVEIRRWATSYIENTLRNMGRTDRISGDARAFASLWYLGGNLTWMLVNHTQPYVFGQAELSRYTKGAMQRIVKAEKDILTSKLTDEEKALWDDPRVKIQIEETVMAEMAGSDAGVGGKISKALHTATRISMAHGHKVEVLNRKIMILAGYRAMLEQGKSHKEALATALDINSAVNIDMGRYNLPLFASKWPVGRGVYALQSFIQHALQYLYYRGTSGEAKDQKAILRLLFVMGLIGGLPAAAPGSDELDKIIRRIFGYSPKAALRSWSRKTGQEYGTAGEMLDGFVWHGVPGAGKPFGAGISFTGSVQFRIPVISNLIAGDEVAKSMTGALGGLVQKGIMAGRQAAKGDFVRAAEYAAPTSIGNVMSGIRQMGGVTTTHGKPVEYGGKQLAMNPLEGITRAFGMQPARVADIQELRQIEKQLKTDWSEKRQDALDRSRMEKKLKYIAEFNKELRGSQARGLVNPITAESIKRALQNRTNKKQAAWEKVSGFE